MVVSETNLGKFVDTPHRSIIQDIPDFLRRWPLDITPRKRRRRCGKRGGVIIRLKSYLRAGFSPGSCPLPRTTDYWRSVFRYLPVRSSRWLRYILPDPHPHGNALPDSLGWPPLDLHPRIIHRPRAVGANHANLRPVSKTSVSRNTLHSPKMALINAHSLVNKTYILNDFMSAHNLDFLFITETWVKKGDLSPYSELVPADYCFYDAPRSTGRGGGLAIITRKIFKPRCCLLSYVTYTSFESQLLLLDWSEPIVLALIYRPPHLVKDFIVEFSEFIGDLVTKHDRFLLVGDFNVHVCCPSKLLSTEFLNTIDSFNLQQWVSCPTHHLGHTLDLILTFGLSITGTEVIESLISDHFPIVFMMCLPEIPQLIASTHPIFARILLSFTIKLTL
ncbi:MAG: endonuclease/exonuclease/phosphatase family protein, partial [Aeromonas sp.]